MNQAEWEDWFRQFKNGCEAWEQKKLDESVELKIAVHQKDYAIPSAAA